ncbi:MAG: phenylacetate--CoA ligase family protein [Planctomycetes bacterium]|nr:phenylacetate--CoA ligase family protein [Planctomycetota bacterium]
MTRPPRPGPVARVALGAGRALLGRRFSARLAELRNVEMLAPAELVRRQQQRLAEITRHAAETVPFWREAYRERGLRPDHVRTLTDLRDLPVVDKDVFRSRPLEDFLSEALPAHRRLPYTTSGSTGDPFRFVLDRAALPLVAASHLYFDSWFGIDPFDRHVRVMGPPAADAPPGADTPFGARLRYRLNAALQRRYERLTQRRFTTFRVTADELRHAIEHFRARYVMGYTSTLAALADELLRAGWSSSWPMKAIVTIAEPLTPERRRALEECFRGPVANRYGQREFKFWCAQCVPGDPTRFQVVTELVAAETVHADGSPCEPGELGRLVLTNLHNRVMPFLRYDTRDVAALGPPDPARAGGRGFPFVERLDGRSQEVLVTAAGRRIDPTTVGHFLFVVKGHVDAVRHYQLRCHGDARATLRVVPGPGFRDPETTARLRRDLAELLGAGVDVDVETVAEIPLERSGKRPIIKLLPAEPNPHGSGVDESHYSSPSDV